MRYFIDAFNRYADFHGRSSRTEYWMFVLFNVLFTIIAAIIDFIIFRIPIGLTYLLYSLVILIPSLAIAVRRLHDSGRSGFMLLVGLIPFIGVIWLLALLLAPSEEKDSAYGDYTPEVLDAQMQIQDGDHRKADNAIIILLGWMLFTMLFWRFGPYLEFVPAYGKSYMIVLILQALITGGLSINLAFALKDNSKRVAGLVIVIILLLFDLYRSYEMYYRFGGGIYVPY